jgi:hypothetical protein
VSERRTDLGSSLLGAGAFLLGVALIVFTFQQAWALFQVTPNQALGLKTGEPIQLEAAGSRLVWVIVRILLLALMAGVGSMVAKWGIRMYGVKFEWPWERPKPVPPSQPPT